MQQTAELWLVFEITGSGAALGLHSVLRFGPVLLFGAQAGLLSDRFERLRLLKVTQSLHALSASVLAVTAWLTTPSLLLIYSIVLTQGLVNAVDNPLRRSFVRDLVDDEELSNAVSLNTIIFTLTRTVGPAIAGLVIASLGVQWCFTANATSYGAVLLALHFIDRSRLRPGAYVRRAPGQLREGFRHARMNRDVLMILVVVAFVATFAWNWGVMLPVYATETFGGDASLYGFMMAIVGVGSMVGALITARAIRILDRRIVVSCALLGIALGTAALAPVRIIAFASLFILGAAGTSLIVSSQARLQLGVEDRMSGRMLALFSVGFTGSKPIGGLAAGWLIDLSGARLAFGVGAAAMGLLVAWLIPRTSIPKYQVRQPKSA